MYVYYCIAFLQYFLVSCVQFKTIKQGMMFFAIMNASLYTLFIVSVLYSFIILFIFRYLKSSSCFAHLIKQQIPFTFYVIVHVCAIFSVNQTIFHQIVNQSIFCHIINQPIFCHIVYQSIFYSI